MTFTATTATLEQVTLSDLAGLYMDLSGEEIEYSECLNKYGSDMEKAKESLFNDVKELVKKYGYTGPEDFTAMYWFTQGIMTERRKPKADFCFGYEHSHYPCRTKETIIEKLKNFYKDFIKYNPNILRCKSIYITI